MIIEMKGLSLTEVKELLAKNEERKDVEDYLKSFCKLSKDKAEAMKKEILGLENAKLKDEHIVKILDFLPKDAEDIKKITHDVSLDETEINSILEIVRKY